MNTHIPLTGAPMEDELVHAFTTPSATSRSGHQRQRSLSPYTAPRTQQKSVRGASRGNDDDEDITDRKLHQRGKQIQYGLNTPGYANMHRLIKSDPRLRNGGVLPLQPPSTSLKVSKRAWDVLARKWRRALHLFDDVFIEEEDKDTTTLEEVVEQQRKKWVAARHHRADRSDRKPTPSSVIFAARNSPSVVKRLPMEETMKPILRSLEYFQDLHGIVPDHASSLTRGNTGVSPTDAGIKMFIAPSAEASLFNVLCGGRDEPLSPKGTAGSSRGRSPSPDMPVTPATIVQMRAGAASTSPVDLRQRPVSPHQHNSSAAPAPPVRTAGSALSSLSPFAAPFCPPGAPSVVPTRNFSPTLPVHNGQGISGFPSFRADAPAYCPSPAVRLEHSFSGAVDPSAGCLPFSPPLFTVPPPYNTWKPASSD